MSADWTYHPRGWQRGPTGALELRYGDPAGNV